MAGMQPLSFDALLDWMLTELEENDSILGLHRSLFYLPPAEAPWATCIFAHPLATPVGPAAGPHTQLAQNILCAWLCGGRFIELKTVQVMDELEIPRPCIDMADEGYNVEWSQELKLEQSADEYVKAWVLIHVLRRALGMEGRAPFGTVFNMSVGYTLEGVQSPPMARFMDRMQDAAEEIAAMRAVLQERFPRFADVEIPTRVADNVTLSTMHGCPPDEIERIARYLLEARGLHTTVKLNPTLLGQERVLDILHNALGFTEIRIPEQVFAHDLQYAQAVALVRNLKAAALEQGLAFGVKLSNTLAMANHRQVLPGDEMYMSGRALYPITINLFHELSQEFGGELNVSFSAGADALNVTDLLACGALPVTAASDLLKPGGYARLRQYVDNLEQGMRERGASSLEDLAGDRLANLERAAAQALQAPRYKKGYHPYGLPKIPSPLARFDCIAAPCAAQCAVQQDVSEYAWLIAQGDHDRALAVILARNPLPGVTGYVCTQLCQTRCTRNNYDQPVAIRALKRFAAERGAATLSPAEPTGRRVAVIGSGPAGLAAAYFLALNGVAVTVYEAQDRPGGMLAIAPAFRLPEAVLQEDVARIESLGVEIVCSQPIAGPPEALLKQGFDAVYVATGAPREARLGIDGEDGPGVYQALDLLERVSRGQAVDLGQRVLVVGGGNTAMDAARTARRLTGGPVTVVYRRTRQEMPAAEEELEALLVESCRLEELASPSRILLEEGRFAGLECLRNELGEPGPDGRRRPQPIPGSTFRIAADALIVAVGQRPDVSFFDGSAVSLRSNGAVVVDDETGRTSVQRVYAGGDAVRGPAIIVEACADGRRAAEAICRAFDLPFVRPVALLPRLSADEMLQVKRARAQQAGQQQPPLLPPEQRTGFDLVELSLTETEARAEAARCLQCAAFCDKCVQVCPNRANYAVRVDPLDVTLPLVAFRDGQAVVDGGARFRVAQERQIVHVADFCNECGNCATFCVYDGRPYLDKPRLFLNRAAFERETGDAFRVMRLNGGWAIERREEGQLSRLVLDSDAGLIEFENRWLQARFSLPDFQLQKLLLQKEFSGRLSLLSVGEMALILLGVVRSIPLPREL
ncbi:MAG: putative selenate reductase subunit YgfK [Anaerolineae bacterium]|nr:putative selenate reductase subunit YgfK [Anaerolineae bacterium]